MSGYSNPSPPRPIAEQTWRSHHTGRTAVGVDFYDFEPSQTSGCQRRRRKRIMRGEWFNQLIIKHQYRQRIMLGVPHE